MAATPTNSMNLNSTTGGLVNWDGTKVMSSTALTQYFVLSGNTSNTVNNIDPTNNIGWVLKSNGNAAQPTFQAPTVSLLPWTDEAISFAAVANHGYFVTANATATLPALPNQGDTIDFAITAVATTLTVTANTGQFIQVGLIQSALAGTTVGSQMGDSISLIYQAATTTWFAVGGPQGTWATT